MNISDSRQGPLNLFSWEIWLLLIELVLNPEYSFKVEVGASKTLPTNRVSAVDHVNVRTMLFQDKQNMLIQDHILLDGITETGTVL